MITPNHAALVMIDMQNGFIDEDSPLCIAGAAATVPVCERALAAAREMGMHVFHVQRRYSSDGSDVEPCRFQAWLDGGRPVSSAWPESLEPPEALKPQPGDHIVTKPRFSAFFDTGLDELLRALGVETVVLAGTTTPNCVRSTCYDALSLNYNVAVIEDCTSSRSPEVQEANIADMEYIGAFVLTCDEFCEDGLEDMPDTVGEMRGELSEIERVTTEMAQSALKAAKERAAAQAVDDAAADSSADDSDGENKDGASA